MKKLIIQLLAGTLLTTSGFAGSDAYNFDKVRSVETPFYKGNETNITLYTGKQVHHGDSFVGGISVKYFVNRNVGLGVSGEFLDDNSKTANLMGTVTYRYPIGTSRLAPFVFAGAGGTNTNRDRSDFRFAGQVGAGVELRVTPNVGIIADYNYNFVDGKDNNFGMVRTGMNLSF